MKGGGVVIERRNLLCERENNPTKESTRATTNVINTTAEYYTTGHPYTSNL